MNKLEKLYADFGRTTSEAEALAAQLQQLNQLRAEQYKAIKQLEAEQREAGE